MPLADFMVSRHLELHTGGWQYVIQGQLGVMVRGETMHGEIRNMLLAHVCCSKGLKNAGEPQSREEILYP